MPHMNGLQLIQHLRDDERFCDLPVILLTAKGYELDNEDIMTRLGVFEIVSKPFSPRDLCKRVEAALAQHKSQCQQTEPPTTTPPADFVADQTDEPGMPTADSQIASETP